MCKAHSFRGRQAGSIENNDLRVTVLKEGGHIAEILDKRSGVNPLWSGYRSSYGRGFEIRKNTAVGKGAAVESKPSCIVLALHKKSS